MPNFSAEPSRPAWPTMFAHAAVPPAIHVVYIHGMFELHPMLPSTLFRKDLAHAGGYSTTDTHRRLQRCFGRCRCSILSFKAWTTSLTYNTMSHVMLLCNTGTVYMLFRRVAMPTRRCWSNALQTNSPALSGCQSKLPMGCVLKFLLVTSSTVPATPIHSPSGSLTLL